MRCKFILLFTVLFTATFSMNVDANMQNLDERRVLIVYTNQDENAIANVHLIQATMSGLFQQTEFIHVEQLKQSDLNEADIVVVYAKTDEKVPDLAIKMLSNYPKELVVIGEFAEFLEQFNDWTFLNYISIRFIENQQLKYKKVIREIQVDNQTDVLLEGMQYDKTYPLIMKKGNVSYINLTNLYGEERFIFTTFLYDLLEIEKPEVHYAYIRLEDISPVTDPKLLQQAGDYLLDHGIPVYLAVIPVYVNNETGKTMMIRDIPELKAVIDNLVERGAYIIAHGYTHTYRYTETGEGFEFWDSVLNQPITTVSPLDEPTLLEKVYQFSSKEAYDAYLAPYKAIETEYLNDKLTRSIHSLIELGYSPIAFEAPHYTMSTNGYKIASSYFSSIFGQIQLSDTNWEVMTSPLLMSRPTLLNGMMLYPETVGYVDPLLDDPISEIEKNIARVIDVPGSMIGGFYHPYLGIDYLKEMVALYEAVPNLKWLDVKNAPLVVNTDKVSVTTENGEVITQSTLSYKDDLRAMAKERPLEIVLWLIVGLTSIFVGIFMLNIFLLRLRYRKRLFEER
ncbi:DUF2334 domain-containing protein [Lysinibacillus sp. NPDC096418]|uniref:DUF2334 domain-containing protein n=1 Tax=Lysinibacillus sp. NPDC096418 TaxID=3364138 RepID=UPI0038227C54